MMVKIIIYLFHFTRSSNVGSPSGAAAQGPRASDPGCIIFLHHPAGI